MGIVGSMGTGVIGATFGLGDIPSWVGICAGFIAFCFGLYQYRQAQLWKRAEFLASEMAKVFSDRKVGTALLLLDYSRIKLRPDGTRADKNETGFIFDDALCESALRNHQEFA